MDSHKMTTIFAILLIILVSKTVGFKCPHEDRSLKKWSDPSSWSDNMLPEAGGNISLTGDILLDVSPPELSGLTIEPGAKLVWSPELQLHIRSKYILVHGEFHIGSKTCPFDNKARITLTGKRNEYEIQGFNEKFLGVASGGVLEIHGRPKLSWTKLTKTVNKITKDNGNIFSHKEKEFYRHYEGLAMYIMNEDGTIYSKDIFFTSGLDKVKTDRDIEDLKNYPKIANQIPDGKIFLLAVQHTLIGSTPYRDLSPVFESVEFIGGISNGQSKIRKISRSGAYVMVAVKGDPSKTKEQLAPMVYRTNRATASTEVNDLVMTAESFIVDRSQRKWLNYIDIRVTKKSLAQPVLDVVDDTSSWKEGDQLLLTSTDYNPDQAETATVLSCPECSGKQVKVSFEPRYMHYGAMQSNVDLRGEVALLSRDIVIEGEMEPSCPTENENCDKFHYDTFGGHVKVLKDFTNVHIQGAELIHMGQQTGLGHYPLHFHMCEDVDGDDYPDPPYLKDNSIHHSYARCITIHGTHGVLKLYQNYSFGKLEEQKMYHLHMNENVCSQVMNNVAFETLGHCYFLEDGGEKRTVFDGNLGAGTHAGTLISSDSRPSTFWITNPKTTLRNNVAAGSDFMGMWFIYPDLPLGPSRDKNFMRENEARYTAITEMDNNAIHSCENSGLMIDNHLNSKGDIASRNDHHPVVDPLDPKSPSKEIVISRLTCYKNMRRNVWIRGGFYRLTQASMADSPASLTFARSTRQEQFLEKSVLIGESDNMGEPMMVYFPDGRKEMSPRSVSYYRAPERPYQGFVFYDGPVHISDTFFDGFVTNAFRPAGAIGFQLKNFAPSSAVSSARNLRFGFVDGVSTGNRVYDGNSTVFDFTDLDGDKGAIFRDIDGSVTTIPYASVVKPIPFVTTPDCVYRDNWGMSICPHIYVKLRFKITSNGDTENKPFLVRDDIPNDVMTLTGDRNMKQFTLISGGQYSYSLHWKDKIPAAMMIALDGMEKNFPLRMGLCLPLDAVFDLRVYWPVRALGLNNWKVASSVHEIDDADEGGIYYHDKSTGMLYVKFWTPDKRTSKTFKDCTTYCPYVLLYIKSGNRYDANCYQRTTPIPPKPSLLRSIKRQAPVSFSAKYDKPEDNWGAGAMLPFTSRQKVDGHYGDWTQWASCSHTCGGGTTTRTRLCNNPIPRNGGVDCVGPRTESKSCKEHPCPVDGKFTSWTQWTNCEGIVKCQGYQTRSRTCTNPKTSNGGEHCEGFTNEMRRCKATRC